ncbi:MAG: hypothetical protein II816_06400, partial [Elusimicrobia bacterium]|nr:hypothetical protein [Elusimicrobiota bacterium]
IVILTVISAPIYNSYASKARQTEGYLVLATIRSAQDQYFNEYANYLLASDSTSVKDGNGFTDNEPQFGINAKGNDYYKLFNINDGSVYNDTKIGFSAIVSAKYGNITLIHNRTTGATAI